MESSSVLEKYANPLNRPLEKMFRNAMKKRSLPRKWKRENVKPIRKMQ